MIDRCRLVLAASAFAVYAFAILYQGHYATAKCAHECQAAYPAAVSFAVHGARLGLIERDLLAYFSRHRIAAEAIENASLAPITVGNTQIAEDGIGVGYLIAASLAMKLFGVHSAAMPLLLLGLMGISTAAFIARFRDGRLIVVPLFYAALTFMLLTWQNTDPHAIQEGTFGGYRSTVLVGLLPTLHIVFDLIDRNRRERWPLALLAGQMALLSAVIVVRSSIAYAVLFIPPVAALALYRARGDHPAQRRIGAIAGALLVVLLLVVKIATSAMPDEYAKTGRLFGNVWHRVFISLSMRAAWPYGDLQAMFRCPKQFFPRGIATQRWDVVGWCAWWATKTDERTYERTDLVDNPSDYYNGTYEAALRSAFFKVLATYPKEVIETFYWDKSIVLVSTLRDGLTITWARIPSGILAANLVQLEILLAFVILSALGGLWLFSMIPAYIAWASIEASVDTIVFMYALLGLALAYGIWGATVVLCAGGTIAKLSYLGRDAIAGFAMAMLGSATIFAVSRYNVGEINHPLLAKRPPPPVPRPTRGIAIEEATYGANCGAPRGNGTRSVALACNGKSSCQYVVDVAKLGDPAGGCGKDFTIAYTCAPDATVQSASAPAEAGFGKVVALACPVPGAPRN